MTAERDMIVTQLDLLKKEYSELSQNKRKDKGGSGKGDKDGGTRNDKIADKNAMQVCGVMRFLSMQVLMIFKLSHVS